MEEAAQLHRKRTSNSECECLVVFILNTRRRVKNRYLVSIGTMDTILCDPREVFCLAINITRDLIRAGQLLKIEVLDHIVIGNSNHSSLRSLGYLLVARVRDEVQFIREVFEKHSKRTVLVPWVTEEPAGPERLQ